MSGWPSASEGPAGWGWGVQRPPLPPSCQVLHVCGLGASHVSPSGTSRGSVGPARVGSNPMSRCPPAGNESLRSVGPGLVFCFYRADNPGVIEVLASQGHMERPWMEAVTQFSGRDRGL